MPRPQERFVIRNSAGLYFDEVKVTRTAAVTLRNVVVGFEETYGAHFVGDIAQAAKFDTEQDAADFIAAPPNLYGLEPDSFTDCSAVSEFTS